MSSTLAALRKKNKAGADPPEAGLFVVRNTPEVISIPPCN